MPSKLSRVNREKVDSIDAANRLAQRHEDLKVARDRDPFVGPVEDRGDRIERASGK